MHIPDGYLSPSTCATLLAGAVPFWFVALRRVKQSLHTAMVPLLSVLAAFSFVVMMFNLPLPGGTTGHAVGMGIATIVVGPWASIVAISAALVMQAVFFGDGGITAIGANCFNMAIAGSLTAYGVYRLIARGAAVGARRRVTAAGLAGYAGINVAALLAAIEFGVQPLWFRDAGGAPLYAPYPLSISIPSMMAGHLTLAGLAELVISAGIVAYLQRADPSMLLATAPDAPDRGRILPAEAAKSALNFRRLWAALALLALLTPLGILAAGSAWGEWAARDFSNPETRRKMAQASGQAAPPERPPRGLERLSKVWTAPFPGYAPPFLRSAGFGYLLSGMMGVGLAMMGGLAAQRFLQSADSSDQTPKRASYVTRTAAGLARAAQEARTAEDTASRPGLLQSLDPRAKLVGVGALIVAAAGVRHLEVLGSMFLGALVIGWLSAMEPVVLLRRVWLPVATFTGVIALPALFLVPGAVIHVVPALGWTITRQGQRSALFLFMRAETIATLAMMLVFSTHWANLLKALRSLRVPPVAVVILGMTERYLFLLLRTAQEMFEARETRLVGALRPEDRRRLAAASAGVLLEKTMQLSAEVHLAMQARGFRGEVYVLDERPMRAAQCLPLGALLLVAAGCWWAGR